MKTTITCKQKAEVVLQKNGDSLFQVMEYSDLNGYINEDSIELIKYVKETNITLKQIRAVLKNSSIKIQRESLSYIKGDIEIKNRSISSKSIAKRILGTKERTIKPFLIGTGEVFFKPSFEFFTIIELDDEEIVIDDTIFFLCEDSITVNLESNIERLASDKSKLKLSGSGFVILKIPVPEEEIVRHKLFNDKLTIIDGCAVLRSGSVDLEVKAINHLYKEYGDYDNSYIHVYEGIGEVWVLPTLSCYEDFTQANKYYDENQIEE